MNSLAVRIKVLKLLYILLIEKKISCIYSYIWFIGSLKRWISGKGGNYIIDNDLSSLGLTYMRSRWMDNATGRFISPDPAKDGINWFVYCSNNPTTLIDPTGLQDDDDDSSSTSTTSSSNPFSFSYSGPYNSLSSPSPFSPFGGYNPFGGGSGSSPSSGPSVLDQIKQKQEELRNKIREWKVEHGVYDMARKYHENISKLLNKQEEYGYVGDPKGLENYLNHKWGYDDPKTGYKGGSSSPTIAEMYTLSKMNLGGFGQYAYNYTRNFDFSFLAPESSLLKAQPFTLNTYIDSLGKYFTSPEFVKKENLLNKIWTGKQYELLDIDPENNVLCLTADMVWDCLDRMNATRTVREVRDIIYKLEEEGLIYEKDGKSGYIHDKTSQRVQNKIWELLGNKTGTWEHSLDSNLENMVGENEYGYVLSPPKILGGMYDPEHWVSVNSLSYKTTYQLAFPFIKKEIDKVNVFDSIRGGYTDIDVSQISNVRIRVVFKP